jgi:two-component system chemotaxis sensor kinase CheA
LPAPPAAPVAISKNIASEVSDKGTAHLTPGTAETIRLSTLRLGHLLFQTEEMLAVKQAFNQQLLDLEQLNQEATQWHQRWNRFAPAFRQLQLAAKTGPPNFEQSEPTAIQGLLDFVNWSHSHWKAHSQRLSQNLTRTKAAQRLSDKMVDDLLHDLKKILMLPAASVLRSFPLMVRDLSRSQGKQVTLKLSGQELEIDKRILEDMKEPLIHLLRNCIDHGIETPERRQQKGKTPEASIAINFSQSDSRHVLITVSDDGVGINLPKVKETALRNGHISAEEASKLDRQQTLELIFQSSLSTSPIVTDLSGRGLGLAIVREKVDILGGRLSVETSPDEGTCFQITLPLSLATFRGILCETAGRKFIIPTLAVEHVIRTSPTQIKRVGHRETLVVDQTPLPLVRLAAVLGLPDPAATGGKVTCLIIGLGNQRLALCIDQLLGEQEVLVKTLGKQLQHVRNIAGATVLGDGEVVPILNHRDLITSALAIEAPNIGERSQKESHRPPRVLVAEDSITSRALLKNILESAGYEVSTAVDGLDAWHLLQTGSFDAVVSDVDMPHIDGFELTAKIRAESALADLPLILVTAREKRQDRERGIDVGANAYIVKSNFEQSNLLEIIKSFL